MLSLLNFIVMRHAACDPNSAQLLCMNIHYCLVFARLAVETREAVRLSKGLRLLKPLVRRFK